MSDPQIGAAPDPDRASLARFLEGRIPPGLRVVAPDSLASLLGELSPPDPAALPDWAVLRVPEAKGFPIALLRRLLTETTPVFANAAFVVFARQPTFGLTNQRNAGPVRILAEQAAGERPAMPPREEEQAPDEPRPRVSPPPRSGLPAAERPRLPSARPPDAAPPAAGPEAKPASAGASPPPALRPTPQAVAGWGGMPARVAALLGDAAGRRVAALGRGALDLAAASLPPATPVSDGAAGLPEACFDAALVLPPDAAPAPFAEAARLLRPGGTAIVVAENAGSLGRRLAVALGRAVPPGGASAAALRGAAHAAGLVPIHLEGHSLDTWRATAEAPPPGLDPAEPAAALLEEAGQDAGPRHAAWLILLARMP